MVWAGLVMMGRGANTPPLAPHVMQHCSLCLTVKITAIEYDKPTLRLPLMLPLLLLLLLSPLCSRCHCRVQVDVLFEVLPPYGPDYVGSATHASFNAVSQLLQGGFPHAVPEVSNAKQ